MRTPGTPRRYPLARNRRAWSRARTAARRWSAVLETATEPTAEGEWAAVPRARLSLLTPNGDVALRLEVDDAGEPRLYVGRLGAGVTAVLGRDGLDLWVGGNVVASVRAHNGVGALELNDPGGRLLCSLPPARRPS